MQGFRPGRDRLRFFERVERRLQSIDELGEPSDQVDRTALDVVEGQDSVEEPL